MEISGEMKILKMKPNANAKTKHKQYLKLKIYILKDPKSKLDCRGKNQ